MNIPAASGSDVFKHTVRPAPFRKSRTYRLDGDTLYWTLANTTHQLALSDIKSIRIYMPGKSLELTAHCVIVDKSGRKYDIGDRHWYEPGMRPPGAARRFERRTDSFTALVGRIVTRLRQDHPGVEFLKGPGWIEWAFSALSGLAGVAIFVTGLYFMVSRGQWDLAAIIFMLMAVAYMPFLWPIIRTGGPRKVDGVEFDFGPE